MTLHNGRRETVGLLIWFNANQDIWRAAEDLLLAERDVANASDTSDLRFRTLAAAFYTFRTILDDLPTVLRFHTSLDTSLDGFFFADQHDQRSQVSQALVAQRTSLYVSHQYLRMMFLRKYTLLYFNDPISCSASISSASQSLLLTVPSQTGATPTTSMISSPLSNVV